MLVGGGGRGGTHITQLASHAWGALCCCNTHSSYLLWSGTSVTAGNAALCTPSLPVRSLFFASCRFATRISNVFVIGRGNKPLVTLPKGKGVRPTILQEQAKRFGSA